LKTKFIEGPLVIRVRRANKCANRKFYRVVLTRKNLDNRDPYIEDLGSFDPLPNKDNQLIVALNLQRIKEIMSTGVKVNSTVQKLLGNYLSLLSVQKQFAIFPPCRSDGVHASPSALVP
jgi:ribosomal protein S16